MRFSLSFFAAASIAACTPQSEPGPEDTLLALYEEVQQNIGQRVTPLESIPMTEDLRSLLERAEIAADALNEPFVNGDLAADCQDCSSISDIAIGPQSGPEQIPAAAGHRIVEARFTLNGSEPRSVLYDMVETPDGWRVDNIISHGFDLRAEANDYLQQRATADAPAPAD